MMQSIRKQGLFLAVVNPIHHAILCLQLSEPGKNHRLSVAIFKDSLISVDIQIVYTFWNKS